ncbi:glycoside hydrolase family 25 protein [Nocardia sp. NBC_00508]|uniref:glycoside hydrolase family 25 protein n=1 Tax=Nocardia sp. NBC_00508 TaxID=2975992 RepID=UPI002E80E4DE|nr:glycoside hydrolase family 25 protein [Nocardia sp. NBC_00508]WUD69275.1 glycoside hydrolase family 25 protein [Nocardia sp. NBC_00508]
MEIPWPSSTIHCLSIALSLTAPFSVISAIAPVAAAAPTGPDVSSWQHGDGRMIDWFAVKRAGHDFAMIKATEGISYINPYFVADSLMMRAAGMARGTYHYARPKVPPEPQAAMYAAVALGQNGPLDLPPVLDLEDSGGLNPPALIDWTRRYLTTVQALTGRVPIIYTYPSFWRTAMADTAEFSSYPLWIADYRGNAQPEVPGGWSAWTFWQTTDRGSIPGISGRVDLNVYSGAQGDLARFANTGGLTGSG